MTARTKPRRFRVELSPWGASVVDDKRHGLQVAWCGNNATAGAAGYAYTNGAREARRIARLLNAEEALR